MRFHTLVRRFSPGRSSVFRKVGYLSVKNSVDWSMECARDRAFRSGIGDFWGGLDPGECTRTPVDYRFISCLKWGTMKLNGFRLGLSEGDPAVDLETVPLALAGVPAITSNPYTQLGAQTAGRD